MGERGNVGLKKLWMDAVKWDTPLQRITTILSLTAAVFFGSLAFWPEQMGRILWPVLQPIYYPELSEMDCNAQTPSDVGCPDVDIEVPEIEPPINKE